MPRDLRPILVILLAMVIGGAAVAMLMAAPATTGRPSLRIVTATVAGLMTAGALLGWVLALSHLLRRIERENPSELIAVGLGAISVSLLAVSFLALPSDRWQYWMLLGSGCAVSVASAIFRLRAITRKYENKRKAHNV